MKIRVLLADDHAVVRYGLRALLEMSGMEVAGEAGSGPEALELIATLSPEVAVLDLAMPGLNGIDTTSAIRARSPGTRVVILSMYSDREHVHRAFAAGATGYVLKGSASDEIVSAVRAVASGARYLSPELMPAEGLQELGADVPSPLASLSARERQVLQLVVEGHSSAQIATLVNLSPKSVDTYRSRLMKKLGVADLVGLVKFAVQNGLTPGS